MNLSYLQLIKWFIIIIKPKLINYWLFLSHPHFTNKNHLSKISFCSITPLLLFSEHLCSHQAPSLTYHPLLPPWFLFSFSLGEKNLHAIFWYLLYTIFVINFTYTNTKIGSFLREERKQFFWELILRS